jgi:endoglucanase
MGDLRAVRWARHLDVTPQTTHPEREWVEARGGMWANAGLMAGRFPFPRGQALPDCARARTVGPAHVRAAFAQWARELVTPEGAGDGLRVRRPDSPGAAADSTVSEGIGYGMIIAVMMDERGLFDGLWSYARRWSMNKTGLMHWYIHPGGRWPLQTGAATDADQDMAWALVMAARQWGGSDTGGVRYLDQAERQIARIWRHEVDHARGDRLLPGDSWGGGASVPFNPSYFAPSHYRLFGEISGNLAGWSRVIDTGYAIIARAQSTARGNARNGLLPAWCSGDGVPIDPASVAAEGGGTAAYQYDAARVPFRIGQHCCYAGDARARDYLGRVSAFFAAIGAGGIVDGYDLDGSPHPDPSAAPDRRQAAVFVGGAAVGAMHDLRYQIFVDEAAALLATGRLLARSRYYGLSWTVLALLMLTGNLNELPD